MIVFFGLFFSVSVYFSNANALAEESGVRIVSPKEGQQFSPGDRVDIEVEIPASVHATDGGVSVKGLGKLEAKEFNGTHFKAGLIIPDSCAGSVELHPWVMAGDFIEGSRLTIIVRPRTAPKELIFSNRNYFLSPSNSETQLYVTGRYPDGIERDLTSSAAGTTYLSGDPKVISVDRDGLCRVVGKGLSVITIENSGVRDFVMVVVEDPQHPNPPVDITNQVSIKRGSRREEQNGNRVIQNVTITNTTDLPIVGPLWLSITDVPDRARAYGDKVNVSLADGLNLFPGQSVTAELTFLLWRNVSIDYKVRLYYATTI